MTGQNSDRNEIDMTSPDKCRTSSGSSVWGFDVIAFIGAMVGDNGKGNTGKKNDQSASQAQLALEFDRVV